jgi:hypothetical protein
LLAEGWQVRGTSRTASGVAAIEAAGMEGAEADPDRIGTVLERVDDVAVLVWALGSAQGSTDVLEAIHGPRLEHLLERLVDTPVRGFTYEGAGSVPREVLATGAAVVREAERRWRIRTQVVEQPPSDHAAWTGAMAAAAASALGLG